MKKGEMNMENKELNLNELASAAGGTGEDVRYFIHTVRKHETLHMIAKHYGVQVDDLMRWNSIADRNLIYVGQEIRVYQ